jgi:NAD(P)-dependent dehydrogenase (short-subunit alcohol dehydrogenase family)
VSRIPKWGPDDIGDLTGRTALVTGANSGIGFEAAVELAAHGAHVVLGCRDSVKADIAADRIVGSAPKASVEVLPLDLSSLDSVRRAAAKFATEHARLDMLINNAGIMGTPYQLTGDGFELQFETNHLGPFALTGLLLDTLLTTGGSRVVTVSSHMAMLGHFNFSNLQGRHNRWLAYGTTKLANLAFTYELDRRLRAYGERTIAVAVHPGWTRTNLFSSRSIARLGQPPERGALPTLYAATAPGVEGGDFYGPRHAAQMFGPPKKVHSVRRSRRESDLAELWRVSEVLTGVHYEFEPRPADA